MLSRLQGRSAHTASPSLLTKSLSVNHSKKSPKNSKCTPNCETSADALWRQYVQLTEVEAAFRALKSLHRSLRVLSRVVARGGLKDAGK